MLIYVPLRFHEIFLNLFRKYFAQMKNPWMKIRMLHQKLFQPYCVNSEKGERYFWIFFFENAFGLLVSVLNERLRDIVSEQIRKFTLYKIY